MAIFVKYSKRQWSLKSRGLKYYDSKLGNHIDITRRDSNNKVVLQSVSPVEADIYFNNTTGKYRNPQLKYADLQFEKGTGTYKISRKNTMTLKKKGVWILIPEFKFTLYKMICYSLKKQKQKNNSFPFSFLELYLNKKALC